MSKCKLPRGASNPGLGRRAYVAAQYPYVVRCPSCDCHVNLPSCEPVGLKTAGEQLGEQVEAALPECVLVVASNLGITGIAKLTKDSYTFEDGSFIHQLNGVWFYTNPMGETNVSSKTLAGDYQDPREPENFLLIRYCA